MNCGGSLDNLIDALYPSITVPGTGIDKYFLERIILSLLNESVDGINSVVLNHFPGEEITYLSVNSLAVEGDDASNPYPQEFLNTITGTGLPLHKIGLKEETFIMLLQNLALAQSLYNETRMIITKCSARVLEACLLGGSYAGEIVMIPYITLTSSNDELPFKFSRCQFPVRLAFAMTINKVQGQSVKHVGLDLRTPVFTYGQLYVVLSRSTSGQRIKFLFPSDDTVSINIIYPEVLLH